MEREIGRRIGAVVAVLRSLSRTVVTKRELSRKAKLSIYRSILTYGHEGRVMTERTRLRVQAAEMSFLRRVAGVSLRDRVRSSARYTVYTNTKQKLNEQKRLYDCSENNK